VRDGHLKASDALGALGISAPFWVATAWNTRRIFDALPPEPPSCFIVTAATRGHPAIVGPLVELAPGSRVNHQLVRFWRFEASWRGRHPASHAAVRRVYDRIAPWIAACIRSRWQADLVYLALKPLELVVAAAVFDPLKGAEAKGAAAIDKVCANVGGNPPCHSSINDTGAEWIGLVESASTATSRTSPAARERDAVGRGPV
jgi:hypothetical protein